MRLEIIYSLKMEKAGGKIILPIEIKDKKQYVVKEKKVVEEKSEDDDE